MSIKPRKARQIESAITHADEAAQSSSQILQTEGSSLVHPTTAISTAEQQQPINAEASLDVPESAGGLSGPFGTASITLSAATPEVADPAPVVSAYPVAGLTVPAADTPAATDTAYNGASSTAVPTDQHEAEFSGETLAWALVGIGFSAVQFVGELSFLTLLAVLVHSVDYAAARLRRAYPLVLNNILTHHLCTHLLARLHAHMHASHTSMLMLVGHCCCSSFALWVMPNSCHPILSIAAAC